MAKTFYRMLLKKLEEEAKKASKKSSTPIIKKKEEEDSQEAATILSTQNKPSIYTDTPKQGLLGTVKNSTETTVNLPKASQVISSAADIPASDKPVQKNESTETIREGTQIKNRVTSALEKKYGPIIAKGAFDGIDDDTVEKNVDLANASIKTSLKNGSMTNEQFKKLPYMREGLTLFYAASEKGNKTAANKAYEAAYTEEESPKIDNYSAKKEFSSKSTLPKLELRFIDKLFNDTIKNVKGDSYYDFTVDGKGLDVELDPTPLEAAKMLEHLGKIMEPGKKLSNEKSENVIGDWRLSGIYEQNDEGLDIGVFEKNVNGKMTYAVVNLGSTLSFSGIPKTVETAKDWMNNFQQPFGKSKDMVDSIDFAEKFVYDHPDANIVFVGHSKGGAEAAANAVATGKKAILFNPASVNLAGYDLNPDNYDSDMTAYIVDGEILNEIFGDVSTPIGSVEKIGEKSTLRKIAEGISSSKNIYEIIDSIYRHTMTKVLKELSEEEENAKNH